MNAYRCLWACAFTVLVGCGGSSGSMTEPSSASPTPTATPSPSPQLRLIPTADATLYESASGDLASGRGGSLFAGATRSGQLRRLVLAFDVSALPQDMPTEAVLELQATKLGFSDSKSYSLHRLLEGWSEGPSDAGVTRAGGGAPAQDGDVTWIHRNFEDSTWGVAGGVFVDEPSAQAIVSERGWVSFQSLNQGLEQDLALWRSDPASNFGWIILGPESQSSSAVEWASREFPDADQRPRLNLNY